MEEKYMQMIIENNQSVKSAHHRLDKLEDDIGEIKELTIAVKEIAMEMKAMREDQNKINERLKIIEEKPIKDYEDTKKQVKGKVISFITGIVLTAIAFLFGLQKFM